MNDNDRTKILNAAEPSDAALKKEKAELEEKIYKLEERYDWIERELEYIRRSMSYKNLDDKDDLKMERLGIDYELVRCRSRLREIEDLTKPSPPADT